jgi:hypothetical protein
LGINIKHPSAKSLGTWMFDIIWLTEAATVFGISRSMFICVGFAAGTLDDLAVKTILKRLWHKAL